MSKKYELEIDIKTGGDLATLLTQLEKLEDLKQKLKGDIQAIPDNNIKGITDAISAQNELIAKQKALKAAILETANAEIKLEEANRKKLQTEEQLIKNGTAQLKQDEQLTKNAENRVKEADRIAKLEQLELDRKAKALKAQEQQNSAYNKASKSLLEMQKNIRNLIIESKPIPKDVTAAFIELDAKIRAADHATGNHSRSVGDYKAKWDGLGQSILQVGRELPTIAFGPRIFFAAISNNLPQVQEQFKKTRDEMNKMKEAGLATPSMFSKIMSSVTSTTFLFTLGVTALTLFGEQLLELGMQLFKNGDDFKTNADIVKEYNKRMLEYTNERIEHTYHEIIVKGEAISKEKGLEARALVDRLKQIRENNHKIEEAKQSHVKALLDIKKQFNLNDDAVLSTGEFDKKRKQEKAYADLQKITRASGRGSGGTFLTNEKKLYNAVLAAENNFYAELKAARVSDSDSQKELADAANKALKESKNKSLGQKANYDGEFIKKTKEINFEKIKSEATSSEEILDIETAKEKESLRILYEADKLKIKAVIANGKNTKEEKKKANDDLLIIDEKFRTANLDLQTIYFDKLFKIETDKQDIEGKIIEDKFKAGLEFQKEAKSIHEDRLISDAANTFISAKQEIENLKLAEKEKLRIQKENNEAEIKSKYEKGLKTIEDQKVLDQAMIDLNVTYKNKIADIDKNAADKKAALDKKANEDAKKFFDDLLKAFIDSEKRKSAEKLKQFDDRISDEKKYTDYQRQRATAGLSNTLEFEQGNLAKLEIEKQKAQKKEERRLKALAFISLLAGYAKTDAKTAFPNALKDTAKTEIATAAFKEKGGLAGSNTETTQISGGMLSRSHGWNNDILAVLDRREGILTANQMSKIGGENGLNKLGVLIDSGTLFNNKNVMFPEIPIFKDNSIVYNDNKLIEEVRSLQNIIKNKKETAVNVDEYGNIIKRESENGYTRVIKKMRERPRF